MSRAKYGKLNFTPASIAAAGNSQATATAMGTSNHVTVSAADGTKGIKLPEPSPGQLALVYNEHASAGLKVYPHVGGDINDGTVNVEVAIEGKTLATFWAID